MVAPEVHAQPGQDPHAFELEQDHDFSQFLLHSKFEIVAVLRALIQKVAIVTVYFDHGKSFMLTSVLALGADNNDFIIDIASDREMNNMALTAKKLIFSTAIDKVKIQFSVDKLSETSHDGRPALSSALPDTLLRLQRREYFRLSAPIASPIKCTIEMKRADGSAFIAEVPLLDISGGGVGLMVHPEQSGLYEPETRFSNCKITLPDESLLVATLRVRNAFDVTSKNGAHHVRVGCEFIDLQGSRLTIIQRYITRVERDRKARMSGLG